jgi:acetyl-CoA carboxylase biotin carboxyl carrier protein
MKINEIQDLIKLVSRSNVNEVEIEQNDTKITIRSDGASKRKKKGQKDEEEEEQKNPWANMPFPMMFPMPQQMGAAPQQMPPQQQAPQEAPQPQQAPQAGGDTQQKEDKGDEAGSDDSNYVTVRSPMIGTFYRSPSPDKDPFVNVGDSVKEGDVLCVIEAMKLFNEIEAEQGGKIVKVLVDDASPVEYDQPLFLLDPS